MNTDDLIRAMSADTQAPRPVAEVLPLAVLVTALGAGAFFLGGMGVRSDLASALTDARVILKQLFPVVLALGAFVLSLRLSRPGARPGAALAVLAAVPVVLIAALVFAMVSRPMATWDSVVFVPALWVCLTSIPLMSLPILAGSLWALRRGASTHPALSGAVAGLLSSATAATAYAFYCTEDSPLFYVVWYAIAIALVTALGALAGCRLLRW